MSSYAILPYIGEPFATLFIPLMTGTLRMKRDATIDLTTAEIALTAPFPDIVNPPYGDMITTTTTILFTFWLSPGAYHTLMFFYLALFGVILYLNNRTRILKWNSASFYGSRWIHEVESCLWALPLCFMAASLERQAFLGERSGFRMAAIHIMAHVLVVRYVLQAFEAPYVASDVPYKAVVERRKGVSALANYWNVNPIEVLKELRRKQTTDSTASESTKSSAPSVAYEIVFFNLNRAYLQPKANHNFDGEEAYVQRTYKQFNKPIKTCCRACYRCCGRKKPAEERVGQPEPSTIGNKPITPDVSPNYKGRRWSDTSPGVTSAPATSPALRRSNEQGTGAMPKVDVEGISNEKKMSGHGETSLKAIRENPRYSLLSDLKE
jgi:hypothetical protein